MESPEQYVFAYQHNVFVAGKFDKVVGHNQYSVVVYNWFENMAIHNLQSLVSQVLGRLDIDQIQSELVNQVQTVVGFAGIVVVGIVPAKVFGPFDVAQYWEIDQVAD